MNREDVIRLAKEADVYVRGHYDEPGLTPEELERFANLVEAQQSDKYKKENEQAEPVAEQAHYCGNCLGIEPESCLFNRIENGKGDYAQALSDTSLDLERMTIERDRYKALAGELAAALRDMVELRELTMQSRVNHEKPEMVVASRAKALVAKYEQEKGV
jgi:hypothetical protein